MSENEQTGLGVEKEIPPWLQPVPEEEQAEGLFEGKKTLILTAVAATSVVTLFVIALLYLYDGANDQPPRHVEADPTPVREKPAEAGGMNVPHQDKQVFDQGASIASNSVKLDEQPEQPLTEIPEEPVATPVAEVDQPDVSVSATVNEPESTEEDVEPAEEAAVKETTSNDPIGSFKVQLGAYGSEESAARAWRTVRGKYGAILEGLSPFYEAVQSGDRTLYRLRLGPLMSRAAADEVCLGLRAQQQACIVVNP